MFCKPPRLQYLVTKALRDRDKWKSGNILEENFVAKVE